MKLIDELKGIGPISKKKLNEHGVYTIQDAVRVGPMKLVEYTNRSLDEDTAEAAVLQATRILEDELLLAPTIQNGREIDEKRRNLEKMTTGCGVLDELLLGGVEVGTSLEIYGDFAAGKSQLMHQLAVMAQLPKEKGGLNGRVLWVDSEATFRPERIKQIVLSRGLIPVKEQDKADKKAGKLPEPENEDDLMRFLENIQVAKPLNAGHQHWIIEHLGEFIDKDASNDATTPKVKLMIIDSLTKLFRGEYLGRGYLSARQIGLNEHIRMLTGLPELYHIAMVWTNQVLDDPSVTMGDPIRPVGGHIVAHASTYRIYLRKSGRKRIAIMKDSPMHPEGEVVYELGVEGLTDPKSEE